MGKGDKRTKKGKVKAKSHGNKRPNASKIKAVTKAKKIATKKKAS